MIIIIPVKTQLSILELQKRKIAVHKFEQYASVHLYYTIERPIYIYMQLFKKTNKYLYGNDFTNYNTYSWLKTTSTKTG